jgi:hypothetical protein
MDNLASQTESVPEVPMVPMLVQDQVMRVVTTLGSYAEEEINKWIPVCDYGLQIIDAKSYDYLGEVDHITFKKKATNPCVRHSQLCFILVSRPMQNHLVRQLTISIGRERSMLDR